MPDPEPLRLFEFFCDVWTLNPYDRCDFRCTYCITQAQGTSRPKLAVDRVAGQLRCEFAADPPKHAIIVGGMADAYPGPEADLRLTRRVLEELIALGREFHVVTKSPLVVRDADLLAHAVCKVQVSISSLDDDVIADLDPGAPPPSARLDAVERLLAAGVDVTVAGTPWLPGISDARALIARVPEAVPIQFGPLTIVPGRERSVNVLGRRYNQAEINRLYLEDRQRAGEHARVRWMYPAGADIGEQRYLTAFMPALDPA